jgi:hypothetical protein
MLLKKKQASLDPARLGRLCSGGAAEYRFRFWGFASGESSLALKLSLARLRLQYVNVWRFCVLWFYASFPFSGSPCSGKAQGLR